MEIYTKLKKQTSPTAVALGYFDGVHLGHQAIINCATGYKKHGFIPVVFTFKKSPKSIIFNIPEQKIFSQEQKEKTFEKLGTQALYSVDFKEMQNLSAEEFVQNVLKNTLNAKIAVCGFNYHFGKGGKSDAQDLKNLCLKYNIAVKIIKPVTYKGTPISSTRIKKALQEKRIDEVNKMLNLDFY